jgi:hypothetical protein
MMSEWGVPWDYIDTHWTPRQIQAFGEALRDRLKRQSQPTHSRSGGRMVRHERNPIKVD